MQFQTIDPSRTNPSHPAHNAHGNPLNDHGDRVQTVATTGLYTPEFCFDAIRVLLTMKAPGLKPIDHAVMAHLISRLPTHQTSYISDSEMGEQLGCDPRSIAKSYKRLKARGWIHHNKNITRSMKDKGRIIIDRKPATVIINFDKFPKEVKAADPVTEDAKLLAKQYQAAIVKLGITSINPVLRKAGKYISSRGKTLLARESRAAQNLIGEFDGDVDQTFAFVNFAVSNGHKAALHSLSRLHTQRKKIISEWSGAKDESQG